MTDESQWSFLNRIDSSSYADAEWRRISPNSYPFFRHYLSSTGRYDVASLPCPREPANFLLRHTITNDNGIIEEEGVDCDCRAALLSKRDLQIMSLDMKSLASDIATAIHIDKCYKAIESGSYLIGELKRRKQNIRNVYLCRGSSSGMIESRIKNILVQDHDAPIILLAERTASADIRKAIANVNGDLLLLSEEIALSSSGISMLENSHFQQPPASPVPIQKRIHIVTSANVTWKDIALYYDEDEDFFVVRIRDKQRDERLTAENMLLTKGKERKKPYILLTKFAIADGQENEVTFDSSEKKDWDYSKKELTKCLQEIFGISSPPFTSFNPQHSHAKNGISGWKSSLTIRTTSWIDVREHADAYIKYHYGSESFAANL